MEFVEEGASPNNESTAEDQNQIVDPLAEEEICDVVVIDNEPLAKKAKYSKVREIDLKQILDAHPLGPSIQIIYQCTQSLCSHSQSYLVYIILTFLLKKYGQ